MHAKGRPIDASDLISLRMPSACVPHSMYASMPVCESVACQHVCDCMPGTAWPGGAAGQSGVPEHPRLQPLSSMLELVPVLTFIISILLFRIYLQLVPWSCKMPSRLTHVVIIDSLAHFEEISFLQSCFVNVGVGESVGGGG